VASEEKNFIKNCCEYLSERWQHMLKITEEDKIAKPLGQQYEWCRKIIRECLTSKTKSYHYVLPTQLLAKAVNPNLDCRSLQAAYNNPGAFDARTIAHSVIVPFDKENHKVLGGSPEPYVNNPLRCPSISPNYRNRQKNREDWDKLSKILEFVENTDNKVLVKKFFDQVLLEIHRLLTDVQVVYPTPNRISFDKTVQLLKNFISEKSGGDRIEAITVALFQTIGESFHLFVKVKREKITAADAASGMSGDIECSKNNKIVLLIEVKDKILTLIQIESTLDAARSGQISEIIFMAQKGVDVKEAKNIKKKINQEYISGQNIYIVELLDFAKGILMLLGEKGRVDYICKIGPELDRTNSAISHRKAWADLLREA